MAARRALLAALLPLLGSSVKFQVEMLQDPQKGEFTPGVPCNCLENSCFKAYDQDGDGCLSQAECNLQAPLGANCSLKAWNPDGDDCINETTEWPGIFERTNGEVCPLAIADEAPSECAGGFYLAGTPPKCERCHNGATRRRRSLSCTKCEHGLVDRGDFDACVDPGLCDACFGSEPTAGCKCPCTSFTVGDTVSSFGLPVDPLCVASGNETCELFKVTAKVTAVSPDPGTGLCNVETNSLSNTSCTAVYGAGSPQCTKRPLVHVCTTTDGTEFSRKYSGNKPPICACGEKHCTKKELCHIGGGEKGEDVCLKAGPYPVHETPAPTVGARGNLVNLQGEHFDINHAGDFTLLRFPQDEEKPAELHMLANIQPEFGRPCTTYITSLQLSGDWLGGKSLQIRSFRRSHSNKTGDDFLGARLVEKGKSDDAPWQNIEEFEPAERVLSKKGAPVHVSLAKSQWFHKKRSTGRVPAVAGMFTLHVRNKKNPEGAKVVVRQDLPDQEHLNVAVRRLSQLGRVEVGGLLGFDQHPESLEFVSAQCRHHRAVTPTQVESTEDMPYYFRPAPGAQGRRNKDTDAAATLITGKKMEDEDDDEDSDSEALGTAMCKCPSGHGVYGSFTAEGVIVEARDANFLMAKASW